METASQIWLSASHLRTTNRQLARPEVVQGKGDGGFIEKDNPKRPQHCAAVSPVGRSEWRRLPGSVTAATGQPFQPFSCCVSTSAELDVYLGNGDGTFKNPQRYRQNVEVYIRLITETVMENRSGRALSPERFKY